MLESKGNEDVYSDMIILLQHRLSLYKLFNTVDSYTQSAVRYGKMMQKLMTQRSDSYINQLTQAQAQSQAQSLSEAEKGVSEESREFDRVEIRIQTEKLKEVEIFNKCKEFGALCAATKKATELLLNSTTLGSRGSDKNDEDSIDVEWAYCEELVRSQQTSPARLVPLKDFKGSVEYLNCILSDLQNGMDTYSSMAKLQQRQAQSQSQQTTLTYDHILSVTMQISDNNCHLIGRSVYLAHLNVLTGEHMGSYISASMRHWGVPNALINCKSRLFPSYFPSSLLCFSLL